MAEYIEREALLDDISAAKKNGGMGAVAARTLIRYIKRHLAADVIPARHGVWEWDIGDVYACSQCGEKSHVKKVMGEPAWEYCPNCGAKMEGWRN